MRSCPFHDAVPRPYQDAPHDLAQENPDSLQSRQNPPLLSDYQNWKATWVMIAEAEQRENVQEWVDTVKACFQPTSGLPQQC